MTNQPTQTRALEAQGDREEADERRLLLDRPSASLIRADDIERGLQLANVIWFIVNHDRRVGER